MIKIVSSKILVESKKKGKKGKKGPFSYEGRTFSTNPFAVCNKSISKEDSPDKWERCVHHVKDSSEV